MSFALSTGPVPTLADVVNKRLRHPVTTLQGGDQLHLTAPVLSFPKGQALPVYGFCAQYDTQGQLITVRAYVRGGQCIPFSERDARRFPTVNQQERWFGEYLMYLTEIDLLDYADCLRLERLAPALAPLVQPDIAVPYRQAA